MTSLSHSNRWLISRLSSPLAFRVLLNLNTQHGGLVTYISNAKNAPMPTTIPYPTPWLRTWMPPPPAMIYEEYAELRLV